jgi:hypothetical protein
MFPKPADAIFHESFKLHRGSSYVSLLVNAYKRDEAGKIVFLDPDDGSHELAGFESFRHSFYGGQAARALGLRLLSSLATCDLYVEGDELLLLQTEVQCVMEKIDLFTSEANKDHERLDFYIQNILDAIARARNAQGGVVIW